MTAPEPDAPPNTRMRLIEAAIHCFAEKGFDATGIREIAQRAQANSALVQYHFGGKEGLYTAALTYLFERKALDVAPPPSPDAPGARALAERSIRDLLLHLLRDLLQCTAAMALEQAALLLVTREMQNARSQAIPLLTGHMRPYADHMEGCLRVLRPDLDDEGRQDMALSVFGPVFHLHTALPMVRAMRGDAAFPRDLEQLADRFTAFSLRGIGAAAPNQGV